MNNIEKRLSFRIIAFTMAVLVGVTFMPLLRTTVNASKDKKNKQITIKKLMNSLDNKKIGVADKIGGNSYGQYFNVSNPNSNGYVTISGKLKEGYFYQLHLDGSCIKTIDNKSFSISLDMKQYTVGYHTLFMTFKNDKGEFKKDLIDAKFFVPSYFYSAPPNAKGYYSVYSKYYDFHSINNYYKYGSNYEHYAYPTMEFKVKKKKWSRWKNGGFMEPDSDKWYKFKGLKPGSQFKTRLRYTKSFNYEYLDKNGSRISKQFTFRGRYSPVKTFKSGVKKLKFKSIRIKPYHVKRHVRKNFYFGWFRRYYLGKTVWYTYKYKVIIKLKKKPGAKGLLVNGKYIKGNKKKYVKYLGYGVTFQKPSKIKIKLAITSYQNKTYGGYSPLKVKKRRIK